MTNKQAMTGAKKRWGKNAAIDSRLGAEDQSGRERARIAMQQAREERDGIEHEIQQLLLNNPDYQDLLTRKKAAAKAVSEQQGRATSYRFHVGRIDLGMFFAIQGSGDTWEEAFAKADPKPKPKPETAVD